MNDVTPPPSRRSDRPNVDVSNIAKVAARAERRIRIVRALTWGTTALSASLVLAVATLVLRKTNVISEKHAVMAFVVEGVLALVVTALAYARKLPSRAGALALDRHHGLADRLASALSFGALPQADRTPFMDAAIDDALNVVKTVQPAKAVPVRAPRDLGIAAALGVVVAFIALFEIREHKPAMSQKTIDPVDVTADDLDAMRDFLKAQEAKQQTDEAKEATQEFNKLIEDLANKRLDRTEAFRRMQELEDKLARTNEADEKSLEEALQKIGEEMKKSDLTKPDRRVARQQELERRGEEPPRAREEPPPKRQQGRQGAARQDARGAEKRGGERGEEQRGAREEARRAQKGNRSPEEEATRGAPRRRRAERAGERSSSRRRSASSSASINKRSKPHKISAQLDRLDRELQQAAEDLMQRSRRVGERSRSRRRGSSTAWRSKR